MITQIPISLKINAALLQELDEEARLGWPKRNAHINRAISLYLEFQDLRRSIKAYPQARDRLIEAFLKKQKV